MNAQLFAIFGLAACIIIQRLHIGILRRKLKDALAKGGRS